MYRKIVLLLMFTSFHSVAVSISSLLEVADKSGEAYVDVVNTDNYTMFIKLSSTKVEYEAGVRKIVDLDKSNVGSWGLHLSPAYLVLEPGEQKRVKFSYRCELDSCSRAKDIIYGIDFLPEPYEKPEQQGVSMLLGYKTFFYSFCCSSFNKL